MQPAWLLIVLRDGAVPCGNKSERTMNRHCEHRKDVVCRSMPEIPAAGGAEARRLA